MESQHTEWKETWRDDYLRWVCGFANAQGGRLLLGVNDKGAVVGLPDAAKLLEDLPNKVRDLLGLVATGATMGGWMPRRWPRATPICWTSCA